MTLRQRRKGDSILTNLPDPGKHLGTLWGVMGRGISTLSWVGDSIVPNLPAPAQHLGRLWGVRVSAFDLRPAQEIRFWRISLNSGSVLGGFGVSGEPHVDLGLCGKMLEVSGPELIPAINF